MYECRKGVGRDGYKPLKYFGTQPGSIRFSLLIHHFSQVISYLLRCTRVIKQ